MMKNRTNGNPKRELSWLSAIGEAATQQHVQLPPFTDRGMGSAICRSTGGDRFVSLKRRLVPAPKAATDGVEWVLWSEKQEQLVPVVTFREPLHPTKEQVAFILSGLKGWLIDDWTVETAKEWAKSHTAATAGLPEPTAHDLP